MDVHGARANVSILYSYEKVLQINFIYYSIQSIFSGRKKLRWATKLRQRENRYACNT
jgi:hypothetical protein